MLDSGYYLITQLKAKLVCVPQDNYTYLPDHESVATPRRGLSKAKDTPYPHHSHTIATPAHAECGYGVISVWLC
jgi:hypothetical protein